MNNTLSDNIRIILASGSPRRTGLLQTAGIPHEVIVSGADEDVRESVPSKLVEKLSARKAREVFERLLGQGVSGDIVVIGADTVVACDGTILGKPENREDAARMLRMLSARVHHVYTVRDCRGRRAGDYLL